MRKKTTNKEFISALLNCFVWGSGYLYVGEYALGTLWFVAFVMTHLPGFYLGIGFYQTTIAGSSMFMGYLAISIILLYRGLKVEAESKCWQHIVRDWKIFLSGTLIAGFVTELANEFLTKHWWVYHLPRAFQGILMILPLAIGWLFMISLTSLFSYVLIKYTYIRFISAYMLSWIAMGFILEPINSLVLNFWHYPKTTIWTVFDPLGLGFGVMALSIGYGGVGLLTYIGYILLSKLFPAHNS